MIEKCPGAKTFIQPKPELIPCSFCGEEVEIWTDEVKATCPKCQGTVMRCGELLGHKIAGSKKDKAE